MAITYPYQMQPEPEGQELDTFGNPRPALGSPPALSGPVIQRDTQPEYSQQRTQALPPMMDPRRALWGGLIMDIGNFIGSKGRVPMQGLGPRMMMQAEQQNYERQQYAQASAEDRRRWEAEMAADAMAGVGKTPFGTYNPRDYTAESWADMVDSYRRTGQVDPSLLERYERTPKATYVPGLGYGTPTPEGGFDVQISDDAYRNAIAQTELEKAEAARGRVQDPGTGDFEAVPGTQAAVSEEEAARGRVQGAALRSIQAQTVAEDIQRFNVLTDAGDVPFGRWAAAQEMLPPVAQSQGYRNAVSLIESVKGNVGIDSLLRIKASGAGLGQIPQKQLDLLSRLLGELDLKQEEDQFVRTWNRMGEIYTEIWESSDEEMRALGAVPPEVFRPMYVKPDNVSLDLWNEMTPDEKAAFSE